MPYFTTEQPYIYICRLGARETRTTTNTMYTRPDSNDDILRRPSVIKDNFDGGAEWWPESCERPPIA